MVTGGNVGAEDKHNQNIEPDGEAESEDEMDYDEKVEAWYEAWDKRGAPVVKPDVPDEGFVLQPPLEWCPEATLKGKTIQVIVKLANIHLVCFPACS